jgi:predicted TIM-barrel fold metal-dependent hydrolase
MMTRREVLGGAAAAGLAAAGMTAAAAETAVAIEVPPGACDCHVHVIGDQQRFPMAPDRVYTPPAASLDDLLALQRRLQFDRVVIVQPSFYGVDNAAILDGLRQLGPLRAHGIAVIDDKTSPAALDDMVRAGIRGIRLNLETAGEIDPAASGRKLQAAIRQIAGRGWHVQIYTRLPVIAALAAELAAVPVPLVIDHFGGAQAALGPQQPGFDALLALVRSGKAYVKISGAYRVSRLGPDYADAAPLARALIAANPERIVWGTDWPHTDSARAPGRPATDVSPFQPIDDGRLLNQLPSWAPEPAVRRQILVDNPARLYGF